MTDTQMVHIKIPRSMYRALNRIKKAQNKTLSAVVREAVELHVYNEIGEIVSPTVEWGGYNEPDKQDDDQ